MATEDLTVTVPASLAREVDALVKGARPKVSRSALITMWIEDGVRVRKAEDVAKASTARGVKP